VADRDVLAVVRVVELPKLIVGRFDAEALLGDVGDVEDVRLPPMLVLRG
jgi:hypothetical protein